MSFLRGHLGSFLAALATTILLLAIPHTAQADGLDLLGRGKAQGEARFMSGIGTAAFLGAGALLPLVESGEHHTQQSLRVTDSLFTATLITEALKRVTHEQRPDGSTRDSFPSEHATAAFAVATMQAHYHHRQAPLWYAGAALIGASRVQLNRHYWHDVLAGAAIGYATARLELHSQRGLLLRPFIDAHETKNNAHAAALDGSNPINVSSRDIPTNGFAPYLGNSKTERVLGFTFSRAF